ncbi:MAG TPA: glycogen debranching N-terminal domain-containing protein [Ktedonobacterales bacterium]|nr:glycogen debranching N-terminal domain-containing protein [Ktedonobacterales bacterium]
MVDQQKRQEASREQLSKHRREQGSQTAKSSAHSRQLDYSTHISDIRDAITIKYNQVFLLANNVGDIRPKDHGYGMYFRDMCYLDQMELRLQGQPGVPLLADASAGNQAVYELTNPRLQLPDGRILSKERLSVRRVVSLKDGMTQTIEINNLDQVAVTLDVELRFGSHFTDMFTIRGSKPGKRGTLQPPETHRGRVVLKYDGADNHTRTTTLRFSPTPDALDEQRALYSISLKPNEMAKIGVSYELEDENQQGNEEGAGKYTDKTGAGKHTSFSEELAQTPTIETNNALFNRALARSLNDLRMLATANLSDLYLAAGIPWYVALFGRDSLITAFETLAYHPALAKSTLLLLAQYQGARHNAFQDEEPGKILHELRVGERANLREVPMIPYYGTVDATPWFLILLAEYVRWTGDLALFHQLRENVNRALRWMDANEADADNIAGYLTYGSRSEKGLLNQGWKDSDNGIVNADGSICQPPIALVELQGYAYYARRALAQLLDATGAHAHAAHLEQQAADLKQRFNADFWLGGDTGYALCLQRGRRASGAVASNPGQTLFTGIVPSERTQTVAERLMKGDMFCGWGVRTLSAKERAYNPLDYQTGSVWPHDNALIALGMRRQGYIQQMDAIFTGIFQAATHFPEFRLPEVFDGFSMDKYPRPVHYPVACSPQAWAAGALPLLLQTALGLEPDAPSHTLHIHRPHLCDWLTSVTVRGLRIGDSTVDLQYRKEQGVTLVAVLAHSGPVNIAVQY